MHCSSLRVDRIEVASACVSDGEKEAVAQIIDWAESEGLADRVEVLGFVDYQRSVDWIRDAGGQVISYCVAVKNIVGSSSARRWMDMLKISSEP